MPTNDEIVIKVFKEVTFHNLSADNYEDLRQEVALMLLEKEIAEPGFIQTAYNDKWLNWWVVRVAMNMSKTKGKITKMFRHEDNYHNESGVNTEVLNLEHYDEEFELQPNEEEINIERKLKLIEKIQDNPNFNNYEKQLIDLYAQGVNISNLSKETGIPLRSLAWSIAKIKNQIIKEYESDVCGYPIDGVLLLFP